jgi:SAM-dependent methyltransferase
MKTKLAHQGPRVLVANTSGLERARSEYYSRLADHFLAQVDLRSVRTMLEAGCGRGQLTIPLLERLPKRVRLVVVDSSRGDYSGSLDELGSRLRIGRDEERVRLVRSDVRSMTTVAKDSIDLVISNELLCDLKSENEIVKAFKEFHRVLRPRGTMIHGEWLSIPTNKPQAMTIRADGSEGTDTPSRFWNPDEISELMMSIGFSDVEVSFFESTIFLVYEVALKELRDWGVRESFLKRNDRLLRRYGIELPFEHVIKGRKRS